jgi:hypothetical protein
MAGCPKRHRWIAGKQFPLRKPYPTGFTSPVWGVWQQRECEICGAISSRWLPGIDASSPLEALDMARPTKEQQRREMDRLAKISIKQTEQARG